MRRLLTLLLLTSAAVAVGPAAAHADPAGTGYTLAFEDQFNGSGVGCARADGVRFTRVLVRFTRAAA